MSIIVKNIIKALVRLRVLAWSVENAGLILGRNNVFRCIYNVYLINLMIMLYHLINLTIVLYQEISRLPTKRGNACRETGIYARTNQFIAFL